MKRAITSYDLLKMFALMTMIVDHIGYYFSPDDLWLRAVGRLSAPVWLFLIGYARSRDISPRLWTGFLILSIAPFIFGGGLFPLNMLFSILIIRLTIDWIGSYMISEQERMIAVIAIFLLAAPLTFLFMDYGTTGYMTAIFGYMARRRYEGQKTGDEPYYAAFAGLFYVLTAQATFGFDMNQLSFIAFGCTILYMALYFFRPAEFYVPARVAPVFHFFGHKTLEIYVIHLLVFRALAAYFHIGGHGFFHWKWL